MRFNSRGEALTGLGKRWLTDDRQIFQAGSDAAGWNLEDQHGVRIADGGATLLAAGGGKWAASLQTVPIQSRSNFGYASQIGWIWDISLDGTSVVECPDYQAGNQVGLLGGPYISGAGIYDARAFSGGFVASVGNRPYSSRHGWIATPPGVTVFAVCQIGDVLLYSTHAWLVLQRIGSLRGRVICPAPAFYPDMIAAGPASVWIGYTLTQGDTGLHVELVSLSTLTDDLSALRDAPVSPHPEPVPPPSPAPVPAPIVSPEPQPMPGNIPDRSASAATFLAPRLVRFPGEPEKTRAATFDVVNALCHELRKTDRRWGLLLKNGGPRDRSSDVLLYRLSETDAQVVDVVADSEGENGTPRPFWQVKDVRPIEQWREPYPIVDLSGPALPDVHPKPPGADALVQLEAEIRNLKTMVAQQQQAIQSLESRLATSRMPKRIALKGAHGQYLTAEDDRRVTNRSGALGPWETFDVEIVS